MDAARRELTDRERGVLQAIREIGYEDDPYGRSIADWLVWKGLEEKRVQSAVYQVLRRLEGFGLAEVIDQEGGMMGRVYWGLTEAGEAALAEGGGE